MAVAQYIFPGSEGTLISALVIVFAFSVPLARNGYIYAAKWYVWVPILLAHVILLGSIGWWRWPRIKVSPSLISFRGIPQETYDFSVRNDTDSEAYLVRIPFQVPNGMDGKIEPHVAKDEIDSALPLEEYGYCYGNDGHEYVLAEIPVLGSRQSRRLSLIYSGRTPATARAEAITFVNEQPPHSPSLQAGGITGDYRVCHMQGRVK